MSFAFKFNILSFITLHIVILSVFSQYQGGDGSISVSATKIQASCPLIIYPPIFNGGQDDLTTQTGITQRNCSPILTPMIFNGGWDDGYSQIGIKLGMCSPDVLFNVFRGGSENSAVNATLYAGCAPVAAFEASSLAGCVGDTVNFTDLSVHDPASWLWHFPGGNPSSSTVQNPSVIYNNPGIYSVSLTVTSLFGNDILTKTNYLTINALPLVSLSSISPLCINDSVYTLSEGSPTGGIYSGPYITSGVFDLTTAGTGTHYIIYTFTDGFGCSSSDTADLIVNPIYNFTTHHQMCNGETYNWQGTGYTEEGSYTASYTSVNGCDSIYTLHLTVNPEYAFMENHSICNGETYNWQGTGYTEAGMYTANFTSKNGCDSVYTLHLMVNPEYAFMENHSICNGETYNWQGTVYTEEGSYTASYTSVNGFDSVYTLHLTVNPEYAFMENHSICNGETYNWQGTGYTAAGTYTANYTSKNGCDSVFSLYLTVQTTDVSVTNNGTTLTANLPGAEYQWVNCDNAFEAIDGATQQSYSVTTNGNYAVIVKKDLCSDTSECTQVSGAGIGSVPGRSINIYPNPVKNELFIEILGNNEKNHLTIVNIMGQVFYEGTFIEKTMVSTFHFPIGVYIIKLEMGRNINFTKFIKEE